MTIIEMNTDEARANSALLAQYIGEFRGIKNEIASNTTTVANNWQSQASLEFQSLMQDIVVEMEGKITNLETLKQSLDSSISANEEVARKLGN
jgi:WXG100 family type VII secretion target